ncbi:photolyase/blue-light receptor [Gracilaria domingensis]|nr:photolyase/blue-light receptor [Gracilaria domingensis]
MRHAALRAHPPHAPPIRARNAPSRLRRNLAAIRRPPCPRSYRPSNPPRRSPRARRRCPQMRRTTYVSQPSLPNATRSSRASFPPASASLPSITTLTISPARTHPARSSSTTPDALPVSSRSLLSRPLYPPPAAPPPSNVIVWFRLDLRLHDHPALLHAVDECQGGSITPLYIFDPRCYGKTSYGFEKTGRHRANFLVQSVTNLRESLVQRGSNLLVLRGHPEKILPRLARQLKASAVVCHKEGAIADTRLEHKVEEALQHSGVAFSSLFSNYLYHVSDLPFPIHDIPDAYAVFREAVQKSCVIRQPLQPPEQLPCFPPIDAGQIPALKDLGLSPPPKEEGGVAFRGGELEALSKLSQIIEDAKNVPRERSVADHLGSDFSCRISPWLSFGCLSARRVHSELQKASKACQTSIYFELVWRDFLRYVNAKYSRITMRRQSNSPLPNRSVPAVAR